MSDVWDTTAPVARPFFRLPPTWGQLPGFGFGLREPSILGIVRVSLPEALDFAALDAGIAQTIPEELPEEESEAGAGLRLARRAMFWTGALQRQANIPVFGKAYIDGPRQNQGCEEFRIALPNFVPQAATMAVEWVGSAINNFLLTGDLNGVSTGEGQQRLADVVKALRKYQLPGINLYRILMAAHALDIPANHLISGAFSLGTGARTRWLQSTFTDRTSRLGTYFATNKMLTAEVLSRAGLPAPTHARVGSPEEAVTVARRLGYPVVVKPADRQQGEGVAADLDSDEAVVEAYRSAARISGIILVEKHFEGKEFRLVVVDGELFGATARLPGGVVGDGEHTIRELVDLENRDPVRIRRSRERRGLQLAFDDEARALVAEAGKTPDTVLAKDEFVRLRRRGNISAGGSARRMETDEIHPDNVRLAETAVKALRLDLAGVDLIIPDITRSWLEVGALICEVNCQPQIGFLSTQPLIEHMFRKGSRIPVVLLVSPAAQVSWEALLPTIPGEKIGYSSASGVWLGTHRIAPAQNSGFLAGAIILSEPDAEAALIHMTPQEVSNLSLPCNSCDALVIAAPDSWGDTERDRLPLIVEIAGPHAKLVIHTPPSQAFDARFGAGNMRGAGETALEDVCGTLLRAALADRTSPA